MGTIAYIFIVVSAIGYLAIMAFLIMIFNGVCDDDQAPLSIRIPLNIAAIFWPVGIPVMMLVDYISNRYGS